MKFGVKTVKFHYSLEFFFINSKNNNDFIGNTNTGKSSFHVGPEG